MMTAATITPKEPSASLRTSKKAARMLKFPSRDDARITMPNTLATKPMTPKTSSSVPGTSGGRNSRRTPSTAV